MSNIAKISLFVVVLSIAILLWSYNKSKTLKEQVQKLSSAQIQYSIGMYEYSHLKAFAMELNYKAPGAIPDFIQPWNGVLGSNESNWYDRIAKKVLPRLASYNTNLRNFRDYEDLGDESLSDNWYQVNEHTTTRLAAVIEGYFKGINLACKGQYLAEYEFIWIGLHYYIQSGQYADRPEVVEVGQFIPREIADEYAQIQQDNPGLTYLQGFGRQNHAGGAVDFMGYDVLIPPVDVSKVPTGVTLSKYYLDANLKPFRNGIGYYETYQYYPGTTGNPPGVLQIVPGMGENDLFDIYYWNIENPNTANNGTA